jgi:hypothetical protein
VTVSSSTSIRRGVVWHRVTDEYRFNIDRTGDAVADDIYTVTFGSNAPGPKQSLTLARNGSTILTGKTGNANNGGGAKVYAGINDDPFFFDLAGFLRWRDPDGDGDYTGSTNLDLGDSSSAPALHDRARSRTLARLVGQLLGDHRAQWRYRRPDGEARPQHGVHEPVWWRQPEGPYNQTAPSARRRNLECAVHCGSRRLQRRATAQAITGLLLPDAPSDVATLGKSTGTGFTGGPGGIPQRPDPGRGCHRPPSCWS